MALHKCPHMTARCPHYEPACEALAGRQCHHVKRTTAARVTASTFLRAVGVKKLAPEMRKYLRYTEKSLKKDKSLRGY